VTAATTATATPTPTRPRSHTAVVRFVEAELTEGRLSVGSRLAGERVLAEQLGVSRPSVREGIRVLEAMGVIRTAAGSGPESGAIVVADASAGITAALRLHLASQNLPMLDVVQTRVLLESWAVRQAAERRDRTALRAAEALLDAMDEPELSAEEFHRLDAEFHVTLARAAGNEVVAAIMTSLRDAIHGYVISSAATLTDWPKAAAKLRRQHRKLLAAITAGETEKAVQRTVRHINGFYATTQLMGPKK
jgi:GntR family transcriptional regulator, transcriptional repressor for pyruvate dehydrogenase complex